MWVVQVCHSNLDVAESKVQRLQSGNQDHLEVPTPDFMEHILAGQSAILAFVSCALLSDCGASQHVHAKLTNHVTEFT